MGTGPGTRSAPWRRSRCGSGRRGSSIADRGRAVGGDRAEANAARDASPEASGELPTTVRDAGRLDGEGGDEERGRGRAR